LLVDLVKAYRVGDTECYFDLQQRIELLLRVAQVIKDGFSIDDSLKEDLKQRRLRPEEKTERVNDLRKIVVAIQEKLSFISKELDAVDGARMAVTTDDVIYSTIRVDIKS